MKFTFSQTSLDIVERYQREERTHAKHVFSKSGGHYLKIIAKDQKLACLYSINNENWIQIAKDIDAKFLQRFTFTGAFAGLYGSSNSEKTQSSFWVDWFEYKDENSVK